jgi:hypothetical protein
MFFDILFYWFLDVFGGWAELNELRQVTQRARSLAHRDGKRRLEPRSRREWLLRRCIFLSESIF